MSRVRWDHPRCCSATCICICLCCHTCDLVIYCRFCQNLFRGFGATRGRNLPFPVTLAIGFYDSLYRQLVLSYEPWHCVVIHVNSVHFAMFDLYSVYYMARCVLHMLCRWLLLHQQISNKMDIDSATDTVKEEPSLVEGTDDAYGLKIISVVSLATGAVGSSTAECVSGDWSLEVKQENSTVVKQEPDDVCCVVLINSRICLIKSYLQGWCRSGKSLKFKIALFTLKITYVFWVLHWWTPQCQANDLCLSRKAFLAVIERLSVISYEISSKVLEYRHLAFVPITTPTYFYFHQLYFA